MKKILGKNEVHVWHARIDRVQAGTPDNIVPHLSADEHVRAGKFLSPDDGALFARGRGILRLLLSRYIGIPPSEIAFNYSETGRPTICSSCCRLPFGFSVSHSRGRAVYAFSPGFPVGVDIEHTRNMAFDAVAERFFSELEFHEYSALNAGIRKDAFFACWTRKEALIKAMGGSIMADMKKYAVSVSPLIPPTVLSVHGQKALANSWSLRDIAVDPGFRAALAVAHSSPRVILYNWKEEHGV